jgi:hypothetical protein
MVVIKCQGPPALGILLVEFAIVLSLYLFYNFVKILNCEVSVGVLLHVFAHHLGK